METPKIDEVSIAHICIEKSLFWGWGKDEMPKYPNLMNWWPSFLPSCFKIPVKLPLFLIFGGKIPLDPLLLRVHYSRRLTETGIFFARNLFFRTILRLSCQIFCISNFVRNPETSAWSWKILKEKKIEDKSRDLAALILR